MFVFCRIIITLLGGSALAFGCFAVVARRYERERDYTYSYGVLYAIIIVSIWLFSGSYMYGGKDAYTVNYNNDFYVSICLFIVCQNTV